MVLLNARKAFDSVNHKYLRKVMEVYGFPMELIEIVTFPYSNNESILNIFKVVIGKGQYSCN